MDRMTEYVCRSCTREITASAFKTTCPDCGGQLKRLGSDRRDAPVADNQA
ncbi:MAG: rubrerythrin-like domain-containing protein [Halobacteriales archaeon]